MKKSVKKKKPTYMQILVRTLYKEYCNSVDMLGESSEISAALAKALQECLEYCDKYAIDYHLNYDSD